LHFEKQWAVCRANGQSNTTEAPRASYNIEDHQQIELHFESNGLFAERMANQILQRHCGQAITLRPIDLLARKENQTNVVISPSGQKATKVQNVLFCE
jgi:hypothetical protein